MAIELLWNWTGQKFGQCPVEVRPCRAGCTDTITTFWGRGPYPFTSVGGWTPVLVGGKWYNVGCPCGDGGCSCTIPGQSISLPGPVWAVEEVLIDGAVLPSTSYRVDDYRWLVRLDGEGWPYCQDLVAPTTALDTWQVSYIQGLPVPIGGQVAAARLACELWKAACGDSSCALPKRIQSITRQGVTVAMLDTMDDLEKGRTGIWLIDSWVIAVTTPQKRGGSVYSVDTIGQRSNRRTTWPTQV
jgi:hypothetical protein